MCSFYPKHITFQLENARGVMCTEESTEELCLNTQVLQHDNNCFMTKELKKAIMLRSKLKNIFNKNKTLFNWQKCKH